MGVEGLGLDPSCKHTIRKLEGPFCLESRGQLSVCLPVCLSLFSLPNAGDDDLIQPTPHSQEDRKGDLARTKSLNLQKTRERA